MNQQMAIRRIVFAVLVHLPQTWVALKNDYVNQTTDILSRSQRGVDENQP